MTSRARQRRRAGSCRTHSNSACITTPWVSIEPFGRPVEPDVNAMIASWSPRAPLWIGAAGASPVATSAASPSNVTRPHGQSDGASRAVVMIPAWSASLTASTASTRARMADTSLGESRSVIGTITAPIFRTASAVKHHCGLAVPMIPTRSPGLTPRRSRSAATASLRRSSSRRLIVVPAWVMAGASGWRRAHDRIGVTRSGRTSRFMIGDLPLVGRSGCGAVGAGHAVRRGWPAARGVPARRLRRTAGYGTRESRLRRCRCRGSRR